MHLKIHVYYNIEVQLFVSLQARPGQVFRLRIHKFGLLRRDSQFSSHNCRQRLIVSDGSDQLRATTHEVSLCDDAHLLELPPSLTSLHETVQLYFLGLENAESSERRFLVEFEGQYMYPARVHVCVHAQHLVYGSSYSAQSRTVHILQLSAVLVSLLHLEPLSQ